MKRWKLLAGILALGAWLAACSSTPKTVTETTTKTTTRSNGALAPAPETGTVVHKTTTIERSTDDDD